MGKTHISPDALTVAEALRRIEAAVQPAPGYTQLPIKNALEKILAEAVCSGINVPPYANSAMDGYALRGADLSACLNFTVIGISWAGKPFDGETGAGQCVRIMTGAAMPRGTDTVIMQEHTVREGDNIRIEADRHKSGENVRQAGEDIAEGQIVLNPGKRLMPADIGLLASLGIPEVKVKRRVRAAFFSTGDELRSVGESLGPGQIYDSNRYTLYGMLTRLGIDFLDLGIIPDQREATEQALQTAASEADLVLTSGGVSVGDADYVTETLQQQGQVNFWKILMKPGHPLTFGKIGSTVFFGLPGNPVSAMVTFYQFVQPALRRMQGETETTPLRLKAPTVSKLKRKPGRTEFQRGILETDASGQLQVRSTGPQGSGVLSSMSKANCFIVLPKEQGSVEPGSIVEVEPFAGLI